MFCTIFFFFFLTFMFFDKNIWCRYQTNTCHKKIGHKPTKENKKKEKTEQHIKSKNIKTKTRSRTNNVARALPQVAHQVKTYQKQNKIIIKCISYDNKFTFLHQLSQTKSSINSTSLHKLYTFACIIIYANNDDKSSGLFECS